MKIIPIALLAVVLTLLQSNAQAQKDYKGTLVTKLGTEQTGIITVDLDGPNSELIQITTVEEKKIKGNKTKQSTSSSFKLNVALINHIVIDGTTYYFRDIKYDYKSSIYMNVCVRLVEGTLDCGMFQNGLSSGNENISVKLPNKELSELVSVDFDYYKATQGWHIMAFGGCPSLKTKMSAKEQGYQWDDATSRDDRIAMWKKWIAEFNACK